MPTVIETLTSKHNRDGFDCGVPSLNDFLARYASQYEKRNLARTYVLLDEQGVKVLGYYTLTSTQIEFASLPADHTKQLPRHPIPAVLLARLAVDLSAKRHGFGKLLLRDCFNRCLLLSEQLGIHSLVVDAINDEAALFYRSFGFNRFLEQPNKLFLPMEVLRKACNP